MSGDDDDQPSAAGLGGLLEKLSPGQDLAAQQSLAALQQRLFGKQRRRLEIGAYVLEDKIAAGSGGAVYTARDTKRERRVALKLLHPGQESLVAQGRARLLREARSLATLSHPNVVKVFDVGTYDPTQLWAGTGPRTVGDAHGVFIAMELVEGSNLGRWLSRSARNWQEVRDVFLAAGQGLAAAHDAGIVHRDFKPANVLVGTDGRVVVADFGLARATQPVAVEPASPADEALALQAAGLGADPMDLSLTASGAFVGTPEYLAPEQYGGGRPDARSDQYSFCVALYEGFFGSSPFASGDEAEVRHAKEDGVFMTPPRDSKVPAGLIRVLHRGLAPRPADRFASMTALLKALRRPRPRAGTVVAAAGVVVAATVAAAMYIGAGSGDPACEVAFDRLHREWSPSARQALRMRIEGVDAPWAAETAERVDARADAWVRGWESELADACSQAEPGDAGGTAAPQLDCLSAQYAALAALREGLLEPTPPRLQGAVDAASRLPPPRACQPDALAGHMAGTGDVEGMLAAAPIRAALGTHAPTQRRLEQLLARTEEDADPRLRARMLLERGRLLAADGSAEAEGALSSALWAFAALEDRTGQALAGLELLALTAFDPDRSADAHMFAGHTDVDRSGVRLGPRFEARARLYRAYSLRTIERVDDAIDVVDEAIAVGQDLGPRLPVLPVVVDAHDLRAELAVAAGDPQRAEAEASRARDVARIVYGPHHPRAARR